MGRERPGNCLGPEPCRPDCHQTHIVGTTQTSRETRLAAQQALAPVAEAVERFASNTRLYTTREAAAILGVQPRTLHAKAHAGKIGFVRDGRHGRFRFRREDLDAYVEANHLPARG